MKNEFEIENSSGFLQAYLHAHMRHKTNEFLRRLQLARPEVKKNFRRVGGNATGRFFSRLNFN